LPSGSKSARIGYIEVEKNAEGKSNLADGVFTLRAPKKGTCYYCTTMKLIKISTDTTRGISNNGDYDDDTAEKKDNASGDKK
jgi:hypothetical protein